MFRRGFTLLEMLAVIAIISLLVALVLPSVTKGRSRSQSVACSAHLRDIGRGWTIYCDENDDVMVPHRIPAIGGTVNDPRFHVEVGNGKKYKPRWAAMVAGALDMKAFDKPDPLNQRQDYDNDALKCPSVLNWVDERNYAYGLNYLFLGNSRDKSGIHYNYPVKRHRIKALSRTVVAGDCMGTAAGFPISFRGSYDNDANNFDDPGNHASTLDAPRLTAVSDRGDDGQGRTAVDPRHLDRANVTFADGHGESLTDRELGYRKRPNGRYVDLDPDDPAGDSFNPQTGSILGPPRSKNLGALGWGYFQVPGSVADPTSNHLFSGSGNDDDPPPIP